MVSRPVVAFLTDFGTRDHYVGAMKGAALSVCPDATLVDITHDIPPQDVRAGALELAAAFSFFPAGTIFVAVVDPGVGSARRGIAVQAGVFRFVAPDNGLLTLALRRSPADLAVDLSNPGYARSQVSKTFEGRDRFAPTAGWLAKGVAIADLGPPIHDLVQLQLPEPVMSDVSLRGEVLHVDHFGNLVTNIERDALGRFAGDRPVRIDVGSQRLAGIVSTYAEASAGALCALFGSSGRLEIAVNGGSAAGRLGLARGAPVVVSRT